MRPAEAIPVLVMPVGEGEEPCTFTLGYFPRCLKHAKAASVDELVSEIHWGTMADTAVRAGNPPPDKSKSYLAWQPFPGARR